MPALQATRIDPGRTMRGELVKDARPGRARNALIGVQVFASALLLVIVSESVARALWPNGDGVGETFRLEQDLNSETRPRDEALQPPRMVTVIGVSREVPGFRFSDVKDAGVFVPTSLDVPKTAVVARVSDDPGLARQTLIDHLTRIDPNMGMIVTMRTVARLETIFLGIAFWVSVVLGGLALLLTVSGLFSVLSDIVEQCTGKLACGWRSALPHGTSPG